MLRRVDGAQINSSFEVFLVDGNVNWRNYNRQCCDLSDADANIKFSDYSDSTMKTNSKTSMRSMTHVVQSMRMKRSRSMSLHECWRWATSIMRRRICCVGYWRRIRNIGWSQCWLCSASHSFTTTTSTMSVTWRWVAKRVFHQLSSDAINAFPLSMAQSGLIASAICRCDVLR